MWFFEKSIFLVDENEWQSMGKLLDNHLNISEKKCPSCSYALNTCELKKQYNECKIITKNPSADVIKFIKKIQNTRLLKYMKLNTKKIIIEKKNQKINAVPWKKYASESSDSDKSGESD